MQREIVSVTQTGDCCPGHDSYPTLAYGNRRSKKARARDKAKEHRHARRSLNRSLGQPR